MKSLLHYEFAPQRRALRDWVVANDLGIPIKSFDTEELAKAFVDKQNAAWFDTHPTWIYPFMPTRPEPSPVPPEFQESGGNDKEFDDADQADADQAAAELPMPMPTAEVSTPAARKTSPRPRSNTAKEGKESL